MNFIKYKKVVAFIVLIGSMAPLFSGAFDLERLKTTTGRQFQEILILDSDEHGLLFRHADGIAKLSYAELSENIRMMFEPVAVGEEKGSEPVDELAEDAVIELPIPLSLVVSSRTYFPIQAVNRGCGGGIPYLEDPCLGAHWPSHWPRFLVERSLAHPVCRARSLDQFLAVTGLGPSGCVSYRSYHPNHSHYRYPRIRRFY
ncbi:MAG: hypothetical protein AAGC68_15120 [Verrucomicrobiota bacterium]